VDRVLFIELELEAVVGLTDQELEQLAAAACDAGVRELLRSQSVRTASGSSAWGPPSSSPTPSDSDAHTVDAASSDPAPL
jgi:hypothetical protein